MQAGQARICMQRCRALIHRNYVLKADEASGNSSNHYRKFWYMNWWEADTHADVPAIVDLVSQALGCTLGESSPAPAQPSSARGVNRSAAQARRGGRSARLKRLIARLRARSEGQW